MKKWAFLAFVVGSFTACSTARHIKNDAVHHISADAKTAKSQISSGQAADNVKRDIRK